MQKRKILSLLLSAAMVLTMLPITVVTAAAATHTVTSEAEFAAAITALASGDVDIVIGGTVVLDDAYQIMNPIDGRKLTISGGGKLVCNNTSSSPLLFGNKLTTVLSNITIDGNGVSRTHALVAISNGATGTLTLDDGAKIINNVSTSDNGGGLSMEGGSVVLNGGEISGNTAIKGGGVFVATGSTFTMNSGTICNNTATDGGGIFAPTNSGNINLWGGTISGNTCTGNGGGINVNRSGTVHVGSTIKIIENTKGSAANNVYLAYGITLVIGESFAEETLPAPGMAVGVNMVFYGSPQDVATSANKVGYLAYFFADDVTTGHATWDGNDGKIQLTYGSNPSGAISITTTTIEQGDSGTSNVTLVNLGGVTKEQLNVVWPGGSAPAGVTATFSDISGGKSTLTFTTSTSTPVGNYSFEVSANTVSSSPTLLKVEARVPKDYGLIFDGSTLKRSDNSEEYPGKGATYTIDSATNTLTLSNFNFETTFQPALSFPTTASVLTLSGTNTIISTNAVGTGTEAAIKATSLTINGTGSLNVEYIAAATSASGIYSTGPLKINGGTISAKGAKRAILSANGFLSVASGATIKGSETINGVLSAAKSTFYTIELDTDDAPNCKYATISFAPITYTITGTIKGSDTSAGISGASVQLKSGGVNSGSSVTTDANGNYTISDVADGTYTVAVSATGYDDDTITDFTVSGSDVTGKDLTLTKTNVSVGNTVTLTINLDDNAYTSHGKQFKLYQNGTEKFAGTGSDDTVTFSEVTDGTYDIYDGAKDTKVDVTVSGAAANATLSYYNVWYAKNGITGVVPTDFNQYLVGEAATVMGRYTLDATQFSGWNTEADGTGTAYQEGDTLIITGITNLYAIAAAATAPSITTVNLNSGKVGTVYSATLTATGTAPIVWSVESGDLPDGLTLSSGGVISGTPTTKGAFTFTVKASNGTAPDATKELAITIVGSDEILYSVTVSANPTDAGTVTGTTTLAQGENTTITATANNGYTFSSWTVTGAGSSVADINSASTAFTMGSEDATVTASFTANPVETYTLTVSAGTGGTVTGTTTLAQGENTTITATANNGYTFSSWMVTGADSSVADINSASTTFTMGSENATVTASFTYNGGSSSISYTPPAKTAGIITAENHNSDNAPEISFDADISEIKGSIFTASELVKIEAGENAVIYVVAEDISDTVSTEEKNVIEKSLEDNTLALYLDISLFKKIGDSDAEKVKNTGNNITISIEIPEEFRAENRVFKIIRLHDGKTDILNGSYDEETGIFTFETNEFSTYALIYEDDVLNSDDDVIEADDDDDTIEADDDDDDDNDENKNPEEGNGGTENSGENNPKTGVTSVSGLLLISAVTAIVFKKRIKKS